jgi:hypothetical protein
VLRKYHFLLGFLKYKCRRQIGTYPIEMIEWEP